MPADPARQIAGRSATDETGANIRAQLGLDQLFHIQYARYLGNLLQGDLGRSYLQRTEVSELIAARMPATLLLMAAAITVELILGLTIGIIAALKRNSALDQSLMVFSFVTISAPQFVVGILLLYVFAVQLNWFPIGGYGTFAHLVLPAITIGLLGTGWYSRMMRSSMIDVLAQDFVDAKQGGAMIFTYKDDVSTLDPAIGYDWQSRSMIKSLFDGLMDYEPGTTELNKGPGRGLHHLG